VVNEDFPYAWVEWSDDEGLAHIIEDEENFDRRIMFDTFASMAELDGLETRGHKEYYFAYFRVTPDQMLRFWKVFQQKFKPFDWSQNKYSN